MARKISSFFCFSFFLFLLLTLNIAGHCHPLKHHTAPTWLTTPHHHRPNTVHNIPTTNPPPRCPIRHATPRYCQLALNTTHNTPPTRLNTARKVQSPPTPTPPQYGAQHPATG
ncbi:hypothetical protein EDB85DRAFT_1895703 [Lactarius pseudohatsudake]|nr:hypothetical protein EDB85DRAFT_1895703 [Lactarius pseudohatsudake]